MKHYNGEDFRFLVGKSIEKVERLKYGGGFYVTIRDVEEEI